MYRILYFILVLSSCYRTGETNEAKVPTDISRLEFEVLLSDFEKTIDAYDKILIIPGVGCSGCITSAQNHFYENYKDTECLYIFTGINDLKLFKIEIPDSLTTYGNVIVDKENVLMELGFNSIYPSYIFSGKNNAMFLETFK